MTIAIEDREAYVASRFDTLEARFKRELADDDYRLNGLLRRLGSVQGKRILDLGCGKGRFATRLSDLGAEVYGLDLSTSMLSNASGIERVQGSARRLPFREGAFDALIAVEVFEHLLDIEEALREARRVLSSSGMILIIDKNAGSFNSRRVWLPNLVIKWVDEARGRWMYPLGGPVRERWFWPSRFRKDLSRHFEEVSVNYLLGEDEARRDLFCRFPSIRLMTLWSATMPSREAS